MIVCNGIVGLCVLAGGIWHREQDFEVRGASAYLAVLTALSVLTLILPNYTHSSPGPTLSHSQLIFVSVVTLLLYGAFLYIQTVRNREYFTELTRSRRRRRRCRRRRGSRCESRRSCLSPR